MKVCLVFPNISVVYLLPDFPLEIFRPLFLVQMFLLDIIPVLSLNHFVHFIWRCNASTQKMLKFEGSDYIIA